MEVSSLVSFPIKILYIYLGGWYWCAFDTPPEVSQDGDVKIIKPAGTGDDPSDTTTSTDGSTVKVIKGPKDVPGTITTIPGKRGLHQKRCFDNGGQSHSLLLLIQKSDVNFVFLSGGWYWCPIEDSVPPTEGNVVARRSEGLYRRCFDNGGGWYWCAFGTEPVPAAASKKRDIDTSAR